MTEAPKELYFYDDWLAQHTKGKLLCGNNRYLHESHVDAMIAAALKVGSEKLRVYNGLMGHEAIRKVVDEIMATTPDEASQALDDLLKAERDKTIQRVVDAIGGLIDPDNREAALHRLNDLISEDATDG